jgi:hypothetical protein
MVKKSLNDKSGQKTIELRRKKQNTVIMQSCNAERTLLKGILPRKRNASLTDALRQDNYKNIIPIAQSLEEAII